MMNRPVRVALAAAAHPRAKTSGDGFPRLSPWNQMDLVIIFIELHPETKRGLSSDHRIEFNC